MWGIQRFCRLKRPQYQKLAMGIPTFGRAYSDMLPGSSYYHPYILPGIFQRPAGDDVMVEADLDGKSLEK